MYSVLSHTTCLKPELLNHHATVCYEWLAGGWDVIFRPASGWAAWSKWNSWTTCLLWGLPVYRYVQFSSVAQSYPTLCTPWTAARQASLSITNSQSLLKLMSIELVTSSNHPIPCHHLLLLPSNLSKHQSLFKWVSSSHQVAKVLELQLQHQSFQWIFRTDFLRTGWISLQFKWLSGVFSNTTVQKHQFFGAQLSL